MKNLNKTGKALMMFLFFVMIFLVVEINQVKATEPLAYAPNFENDINNYDWQNYLTSVGGNLFKSKAQKPIDFKFDNGWYWSSPDKNSWTRVTETYIGVPLRPNRENRNIIHSLAKREKFLQVMREQFIKNKPECTDFYLSTQFINNEFIVSINTIRQDYFIRILESDNLVCKIETKEGESNKAKITEKRIGNCDIKFELYRFGSGLAELSCTESIRISHMGAPPPDEQGSVIITQQLFDYTLKINNQNLNYFKEENSFDSDIIIASIQANGNPAILLKQEQIRWTFENCVDVLSSDPYIRSLRLNPDAINQDDPNDITCNINVEIDGFDEQGVKKVHYLSASVTYKFREEGKPPDSDGTIEEEIEQNSVCKTEGLFRCVRNELYECNETNKWALKETCPSGTTCNEEKGICQLPICKDCFDYYKNCECPSYCVYPGIKIGDTYKKCGGVNQELMCRPQGGECLSEDECKKRQESNETNTFNASDCREDRVCCNLKDGETSTLHDCGHICTNYDGCFCPESCASRPGSNLNMFKSNDRYKIPMDFTCFGNYRSDPFRATNCNNQQKDGICPPGCFWWNDLDCGRDSNIISLLWEELIPDSWKDWYYDSKFVQTVNSLGLMFDINHWAETICNPINRISRDVKKDGYFTSRDTVGWISGLRDLYNESHLIYTQSYYLSNLNEDKKFRIEFRGNNFKFKYPYENTPNATLERNEYWFNVSRSETIQESKVTFLDKRIYHTVCMIFNESIIFHKNLAIETSVEEVCRGINDIWD